ncbi:late competence protein ComER [Alkalibacillus almallahensis]|uniref:late competence protein ComER n=1 Tax=Alkalibacillus almallahensis TaxID=1379154 RepID=UPI001422E40F|nr:late competence protein ComER [Alkalibacillus almallahensis]NIK11311.1 competence protein ComER [Alkalibacillus almallahensis]
MNWGIIGTGNMGTVLLNALVDSRAVDQRNIYIHNRTLLKAYRLKETYPDVHILQTVDAMAASCDIIFICTKPKDIISVANRLDQKLSEDQLVVSITSSISLDHLNHILSCQTARLIPSITNSALRGKTLLTFNDSISDEMKYILWQTCKLFSTPVEISESQVRIASDLVSCGPAFVSYLLEELIEAATSEADIGKELATELVESMMIGYGELLKQDHFDLTSLKEKVMVKGGITGVGMKGLEQSVPAGFNEVFIKTHTKFNREKGHVDEWINQLI